MSLLGNVLHSIGNLIDGNNDEQKKKQQQQQPQISVAPKPVAPVITPPVRPQPALTTQNLGPAPLQKAQPKQPPAQPVNNPNAVPVKAPTPAIPPSPTLASRAISFLKGEGSAAAGTALGIGRAAEGAVEGISQIPKEALDLSTAAGDKLSGTNYRPGYVKTVDNLTKAVDTPIDKLSKETDDAAQNYGPEASALYKPVQVAANVATVIPGGIAAASKVGEGAQLPKLVDAANAARSYIENQKAASPVMAALNKAKAIVADKVPGIGAGTPEIAPGVQTANPNQVQDASAQIAPHVQPMDPSELPAPAGEIVNPTTPPVIAPDINTPAFMRQSPDDAKIPSAAELKYKADQESLRTTGTPTFVRQGQEALQKAAINKLVMTTPPEPQALVKAAKLLPAPTGATARIAQIDKTIADATAGRVALKAGDARALLQERQGLIDNPNAGVLQKGSGKRTVAPVPAREVAAETTPPPSVIGSAKPEETPALLTETPATPLHAAVQPPEAPATSATDISAPSTPGKSPLPEPLDAPTGGNEVPVAPNTRAALIKQMGEAAKNLPGDGKMREATNLDDLRTNAHAALATMSDDDVLNTFATNKLDDVPNDVKGVAMLRAGLDRLSKMDTTNPDVGAALDNAFDAIAERSSGSGLVQRFIQEDFDNMPVPMKVRYIVKNIDSANKDTANFMPLKDDPAKAEAVETAISNYLTSSQTISERITALQGELNKAAEAAQNGEKVDANLGAMAKQVEADQNELRANNGELVKYYQTLVPGSSTGQKINDFARSMMLGSFTGRGNAAIFSVANASHLGLQNVTQGLIAKAVNLVKGPGTVLDTTRGVGAFRRGTVEGAKKMVGEFKGNTYAGDLQKSIKSSGSRLTNMRQGPKSSFVPRTAHIIQSATEVGRNLTTGVKSQRLYQLAYQEGQKRGIEKDLLDQYATARAAAPTHAMSEQADQLYQSVNHLNKNPVSDALNKISAAIGETKPSPNDSFAVKTAKFTAGAIKNQILPFTSFLGGNIWNSVTDKNVVANAVKLTASVAKGDLNGTVENLAKLGNNTAQTYALGYLLTKHGVITNTNAEGYNDDGAYLHIGGRYIPVNFLGFFAPSLVLGNAAYQAINKGGNVADQFGHTLEASITNGIRSTGASALGADNDFFKAMGTVTGTDNKPGDAAAGGAQFAGGAAGEFAPAGLGDINAILNNGLGPIPALNNPNHEAADTKVEKTGLTPSGNPTTAKDIPKSALRTLENKIPVLSQSLPRKAGVAAPDLVDRTTRGDRDTGPELLVKAQQKQTTDQSAADAKANIPDPNAKYATGDSFDSAVENRIENKNYDQALAGLNQQLAKVKSGKDVTSKQTDPIQNQIKQVQVLKAGAYDPSIRSLYSGTTLSEWRDMGDPTNDNYDQKTYNELYAYDSALAKAGVSGSTLKPTDNKYSAKTSGIGSGSAASRERSNTIGTLPSFDFSGITLPKAENVRNAAIPTIQQIKPGDLIKKRSISVSSPA